MWFSFLVLCIKKQPEGCSFSKNERISRGYATATFGIYFAMAFAQPDHRQDAGLFAFENISAIGIRADDLYALRIKEISRAICRYPPVQIEV